MRSISGSGRMKRYLAPAFVWFILSGPATGADVPDRLAAASTYADTVETILADGVGSGDIAALRQATADLAALIDDLVPAQGSRAFIECGVDVWILMDQLVSSLDELSEQSIDAAAFQAEVEALRDLARICLDIWTQER